MVLSRHRRRLFKSASIPLSFSAAANRALLGLVLAGCRSPLLKMIALGDATGTPSTITRAVVVVICIKISSFHHRFFSSVVFLWLQQGSHFAVEVFSIYAGVWPIVRHTHSRHGTSSSAPSATTMSIKTKVGTFC